MTWRATKLIRVTTEPTVKPSADGPRLKSTHGYRSDAVVGQDSVGLCPYRAPRRSSTRAYQLGQVQGCVICPVFLSHYLQPKEERVSIPATN